jgi:UDP-N-acetylglucosamine 2-epimerase (non-hydrolysing)
MKQGNKAGARRRHRVVSIVGTRPEAIKMGPVVRALATRRGIDQQVVLTGQHRGLAPFFAGLPPEQLRELDYNPEGRTAPRLRETLHGLLCGHFSGDPAELVLVQGDTASAFAGAFAARDCGIPIGHVEAGLRSFDLKQPWPEEGNRMAIDALSALLFAPTDAAARNLAADWRVKGRVFVTGNSGIDALLETRDRLRDEPRVTGRQGVRTVLVTCHRKENQGEKLAGICAALKRLVRELPVEIVLPLHPNRHVRSGLDDLLRGEPRIGLREPLAYEEMVRLIDRSWAILTDSGGLQEEGPALGKPVLVLREVTERPEGVVSANIELVGSEPEAIVAAVRALIEDPAKYERMSRPSFPFGDGRASARIAAAVEAWLEPSRSRAEAAR